MRVRFRQMDNSIDKEVNSHWFVVPLLDSDIWCLQTRIDQNTQQQFVQIAERIFIHFVCIIVLTSSIIAHTIWP